MCCLLLRGFAAMAFACLVATRVIAGEAALPAITYSPWIKFCLGNTCFVGRDGRANAECGPVVAAVLIERNGDAKKTLRVILPTRVNLERGVRIIIDQGPTIERPYGDCFASGCMADYDAGAELVDQLKQGRMLVLTATDKANSPINLTVPLVDFANAYDGPPQELKEFEKVLSAEKTQAELDRERRAEEERTARCEAR
jgi:invasion protein IalB